MFCLPKTAWPPTLTVLGTIANRLTVSMIAFNWNLPEREIFNPTEATIVVSVVTIEVLVYRWIVNRMAVLRDDPDIEEKAAPAQKVEERTPVMVPVAAGRH